MVSLLLKWLQCELGARRKLHFNVLGQWHNAGSKQPHQYCIESSPSVKRERCVKFFMHTSSFTGGRRNVQAWSFWHVPLKVQRTRPSHFLQQQQQQTLTELKSTPVVRKMLNITPHSFCFPALKCVRSLAMSCNMKVKSRGTEHEGPSWNCVSITALW